ncbi:MAG: MarR family transcriptional regulator [Actinobacteria bacterium]|jgi:DNA-binding MarR family transcriptional regulator|nr:MarR family transcriptional regulator [Actinomycetota bacterium]PLS84188.1 MAG: MarR family transcriptional regulator [Actinomycetota bacterium]
MAERTGEEKARLRVFREGSLDQGREEAWRALITAHAAAVERIERGLLEAGLPPLGWYDVLLELSAAPGCRLRMHELARAVVLSRSGLSRLVDRLEKAGLLRREPDPEDGRGSFAVLTNEGSRMRERMWPVYAKGIAEHFGAHVSDEEAAVLCRALGRVRDAARGS